MANEKWLINVWKLVVDLAKLERSGQYDHDNVLAVIASQETVEAVEVVRCKDCKQKRKYHQKTPICYCMQHERYMNEDDFCSYGERKDNE